MMAVADDGKNGWVGGTAEEEDSSTNVDGMEKGGEEAKKKYIKSGGLDGPDGISSVFIHKSYFGIWSKPPTNFKSPNKIGD